MVPIDLKEDHSVAGRELSGCSFAGSGSLFGTGSSTSLFGSNAAAPLGSCLQRTLKACTDFACPSVLRQLLPVPKTLQVVCTAVLNPFQSISPIFTPQIYNMLHVDNY